MPHRYTLPPQSAGVYLLWAIAALVARAAMSLAMTTRFALPHAHPARTMLDGRASAADTLSAAMFTGLPVWAIQLARAALLMFLGGLLYALVFDLPDWPGILGLDHDPVFHHPMPQHLP